MRLPYFIAKRFNYHTDANGGRRRQTGVRIATFGIAVGVAIMIIAISVMSGFKGEITRHIVGFGSHIQVFDFGSSYSFERQPIVIEPQTYSTIETVKGIDRVFKTATKTGIIKTPDDFKGVVFKGVGSDYNWDFYAENLLSGQLIDYSKPNAKNKILISNNLAKLLGIEVGDDIYAYFFQEKVRARKFIVEGIYSTTFSEFDKLFVLCNIETIQHLNRWDSTMISSLEIMLGNFDDMDEATMRVGEIVGNKFDKNRLLYTTHNIKEIYPQIFGWLDMLDVNVYIIIVLMMAVAGFNMIAGILILMLEKTQIIGTLKSLGMRNGEVRKTFVVLAIYFVIRGVIWGNIVGVGLVLIQYFTHIIPLDSTFYYTNYAPVSINIWFILLLNIGVLVFSFTVMLIPSHIITKISPAKSIRFE